MAIENTPIYNEVRTILAGNEAIAFKWSCEIIAGVAIVVPFKIVSIDNVRDYNRNYADEIQLVVLIPEGSFNSVIVPYLNSLEIALKRSPVGNNTVITNQEKIIEVQRYRAVYIDNASSYIKGASPDNLTPASADLTGFITVGFQLIDMAIEQIQGRSIGGTFHNTTTGNLLKAILGAESKQIDVPTDISIKGVTMVAPNNDTVKNQIVIEPQALTNLPTYLQVQAGGIYSAGLGFYLQQSMWYVYPEFDTTRFKKELKTLTIINIPPNKLPSVERTFRTTGNQVIVISTGEFLFHDNSDDLQLNLGTGSRFTDANTIVGGFGKYENGKYTVTRTTNNSEFLAIDRGTGINRVMVSESRITSNPYNEYSKLARRNCSHVQLVWENSNYSLLYPGMPCKLIYEDAGNVKEVEGVLNRAHHYTTGQGISGNDGRFVTHSTLVVLIPTLPNPAPTVKK